MQVPFGATYSDDDDVGPHLINVAQSAYSECCIDEHNKSKIKALNVCKAVAKSPGGLHACMLAWTYVQASTAIWISDWDISLTLRARFWSLHIRSFLAKWHVGETGICSLCGL